MGKTIFRAKQRDRYVIVDQRIAVDNRLSFSARGLLVYLLSRPDDWKLIVQDLQRQGNLGRDGVYKLIKELRRAGHICFKPRRDENGRMRGGEYTVWEVPPEPHPELPDTVKPDPVAPYPAGPEPVSPDTVNPEALLNTEIGSTAPLGGQHVYPGSGTVHRAAIVRKRGEFVTVIDR